MKQVIFTCSTPGNDQGYVVWGFWQRDPVKKSLQGGALIELVFKGHLPPKMLYDSMIF